MGFVVVVLGACVSTGLVVVGVVDGLVVVVGARGSMVIVVGTSGSTVIVVGAVDGLVVVVVGDCVPTGFVVVGVRVSTGFVVGVVVVGVVVVGAVVVGAVVVGVVDGLVVVVDGCVSAGSVEVDIRMPPSGDRVQVPFSGHRFACSSCTVSPSCMCQLDSSEGSELEGSTHHLYHW
jgi:hypothetical protein